MMELSTASLLRSARSRTRICSSCISQLHKSARLSHSSPPYSTSASKTLTPPSAGFAYLPTRRLVSIDGPDAAHFLQGLITSNISASSLRSSGFYSAFLNAAGRVLYDVFIYPDQISGASGEGWLIEVDSNEAERLFKHLKRFKLRAKFQLRLVDAEERKVWSLWRDESADTGKGWTEHKMDESKFAIKKGDVACVDSRAPGMGTRMVLPDGQRPPADEMDESTEEMYRVRRYLKGVAEGQSEIIRESALPQESNIDFMGGIDYHKGCYVGQELTIRTHHTGVVRKRILPIVLYRNEDEEQKSPLYSNVPRIDIPPPETSIGRVQSVGRSAGKFLAGTGNIGLGLCRLEIMTERVGPGDNVGYKLGDQFKVSWDEPDGVLKTVRIKAFIPPWHLKK